MSNDTLDRVLNTVLGVLASAGAAASVIGVAGLLLMMLCSGPQGYYLKAAKTGFVSSVYEDIKWSPDRLVFTGPNGSAWQVYNMLTVPEPEPDPPYRTLELKDTVQL